MQVPIDPIYIWNWIWKRLWQWQLINHSILKNITWETYDARRFFNSFSPKKLHRFKSRRNSGRQKLIKTFFFQDSGVGTPVTLRVDPNGFYLYWVDQNHEMDLLDIAIIRDTRTSRHAKIPKVRLHDWIEVYTKSPLKFMTSSPWPVQYGTE